MASPNKNPPKGNQKSKTNTTKSESILPAPTQQPKPTQVAPMQQPDIKQPTQNPPASNPPAKIHPLPGASQSLNAIKLYTPTMTIPPNHHIKISPNQGSIPVAIPEPSPEPNEPDSFVFEDKDSNYMPLSDFQTSAEPSEIHDSDSNWLPLGIEIHTLEDILAERNRLESKDEHEDDDEPQPQPLPNFILASRFRDITPPRGLKYRDPPIVLANLEPDYSDETIAKMEEEDEGPKKLKKPTPPPRRRQRWRKTSSELMRKMELSKARKKDRKLEKPKEEEEEEEEPIVTKFPGLVYSPKPKKPPLTDSEIKQKEKLAKAAKDVQTKRVGFFRKKVVVREEVPTEIPYEQIKDDPLLTFTPMEIKDPTTVAYKGLNLQPDRVYAIVNCTIVAEAHMDQVFGFEGFTYFPYRAVRRQYLKRTSRTLELPGKGTLSYLHVIINGKYNTWAAWEFVDSEPAYDHIDGYYAFWRGVKIF